MRRTWFLLGFMNEMKQSKHIVLESEYYVTKVKGRILHDKRKDIKRFDYVFSKWDDDIHYNELKEAITGQEISKLNK